MGSWYSPIFILKSPSGTNTVCMYLCFVSAIKECHYHLEIFWNKKLSVKEGSTVFLESNVHEHRDNVA